MRLRKRQLQELDQQDHTVHTATIDLTFNKLVSVDLDRFQCRRVFLAYNRIHTVHITRRNEHIETLDLSHNQLNLIPEHLFLFLPNLRTLKVQGNHLQSLPNVSVCGRLEELWVGDCLGGNELCVLHELPPSLVTLMAANNQIEHIDQHVHLQCVDVSNNKLTKLPVLEGCLALRAGGNQITGGQSTLERMPKLELLDVCRNDLRLRFHGRPGLTILQDYGNADIDTMFARTLLGLCLEMSTRSQLAIPRHLSDCGLN